MAKANEQVGQKEKITVNWNNLLFTVMGGVGLLLSTSIVQMFFTTPPTRQEFNGLKNNVNNIEVKLNDLKTGQQAIINHLIKQRE